MHSLAAVRGRGTLAGEAAVSARARVPRQMEYRIDFMFFLLVLFVVTTAVRMFLNARGKKARQKILGYDFFVLIR